MGGSLESQKLSNRLKNNLVSTAGEDTVYGYMGSFVCSSMGRIMLVNLK